MTDDATPPPENLPPHDLPPYDLAPQGAPPSWQDRLLLVINIVFVLMGFVVLRKDRDAGIVTLALFGSCLATTVVTMQRKRRYRSFTAAKVDVIGGVPVRPNAGVMKLLGAWLMGLGIVLVVFGHGYPPLFRYLSGFVAVIGALVLTGALAGLWPGGYLQFDPEALTIAQRNWSAQIPWDAILTVHEGELHSNPVLLIAISDMTRIAIAPPSAHGQAMKAMGRSLAMMGAEFAIMPLHYGNDLPVLSAAVQRYATDASHRAELRPRLG